MTYLERRASFRLILFGLLSAVATVTPVLPAEPQAIQVTEVPTGQAITPTAAAGSLFQDLNPGQPTAPGLRAGQAAALAVSPDGHNLAILTSGYNVYYGQDGQPVPELTTEYVFLFDISRHEPTQIQVIPLTNTFDGLAWSPGSDRLFVSAGSDDVVVELVRSGARFETGRMFHLGHTDCLGIPMSPGFWGTGKRKCGPVVAGLAVSPDGTRLLVANIQNDSVSLIDLASGRVTAEQDLRPGIINPKQRGKPGGSFPRSVLWVSPDRGYVASERDREIVSLRISHEQIRVVRRIPVHGQPIALIANRSGSRVYVALDSTSQVAIIDTHHDKVIETLNVTAPDTVYSMSQALGGANTDALALTPDERTLLVSNGGQNSVAVVRLSDQARGPEAVLKVTAGRASRESDGDDDDDESAGKIHSTVIGLVPTGRYPTGVATSKDGSTWYIINYKSETGPSALWCQPSQTPNPECLPQDFSPRPVPPLSAFDDKYNALKRSLNTMTLQLQKAGLLTLPAPGALELARLTKQVAHNNHFDRPEKAATDEQLFGFLRTHIKHVIYIVKENKTYDEVLGDLDVGNGDPRLTLFPERITPNHHALARNFITLDNFLVPGVGSWTGWDWSVSAQTNDFRERLEAHAAGTTPAKHDGGLEGEPGMSRNMNMLYPTSEERHRYDPTSPTDPDILPGARDVAAPDGPGGAEGKGYLWQAALRRGVSVRNWGFFGGFFTNTAYVPLIRDAYAEKMRVFFPTRPDLDAYSDLYYRSFDPALPDYWRVQEWKREFTEFSRKNSAPQLMLVQLGNDHFGDFARALDGVNTPDTQEADNDYALGLIIEAVAMSPFAKDTLIIAVEDDPLGGLDHAEAFRSVALFAGAYVRQHALVSTRYTTVSIVKTIEEILGLEPIGLNDALAAPMSDIFDPTLTTWSYQALVPGVLRSTALPLPSGSHQACNDRPRGSSAYWTRVMADQDFSAPDQLNVPSFTRSLWRGLNGNARYPTITATGRELSQNRAALLASFHAASSCR